MRSIPSPAVALLLIVGACSTGAGARNAEPPLLASIQATTTSDSVHFLMQVTNTGSRPIALDLASGRGFELLVHQEDVVVWNSSAESAPAQMPVSDTLAPGDTRSFHASWSPPATARGEMHATGVIRDRRGPIQQSTRFHLP